MVFQVLVSAFVLGTILNSVTCAVNGSSYNNQSEINQELILTEREAIALKKFKSAVFNSIPKELSLARTDLYLLRFLRSKNGDVEVAERDFYECLRFIHENKMLTILDENWEDYEEKFPFYFNATDRQGRPIFYISTEDGWNVRLGNIQNGNRLLRYFYKLVFQMFPRMIEAATKDPNVTQVLVILNLSEFSTAEMGCSSCLLQYFRFIDLNRKWIPGYTKEFIIINAPQSIYTLVNAFRSIIPATGFQNLKIFGQNQSQWKSYLSERIDPAQLQKLLSRHVGD